VTKLQYNYCWLQTVPLKRYHNL